MKLTTLQAEVLADLTRITTDGARHQPMFWIGERNVSHQVRRLLSCGVIELHDGRLVKVARLEAQPAAFDQTAAVSAMRTLLSEPEPDVR